MWDNPYLIERKLWDSTEKINLHKRVTLMEFVIILFTEKILIIVIIMYTATEFRTYLCLCVCVFVSAHVYVFTGSCDINSNTTWVIRCS